MKQFTPTIKKTLSNLTWLSIDRAIRLFGAVFVNAWLTRYLGPEQNGILNYSLAFVGMFAPLASLGVDSIVIREIVRDVSKKDEILGSAFLLRLLGAAVALSFSVTAIFLVRADDQTMQFIVIIAGLGLVFQSFDVIDVWFQSQVLSKYTVYAKNLAFILLNIGKIICILAEAHVIWIVVMSSMEVLVGAVGLVTVYTKKHGTPMAWQPTRERMVYIIKNSWPIFFSDLAMMLQLRIDQIFLGEMLGNRDVGLYAASVKLSEPFSFIPMILVSSVFPTIIKSLEWSETVFYDRMQNLYRLMFIVTLGIAVPITLLSGWIVHVMYGEEFAEVSLILSIMIWSRVYTNFGVAKGIFISANNLFKHSLLFSVVGFLINIAANYLLIPVYGVIGSLIATNIALMTTIFFMDALFVKTRKNFTTMMSAIFTFYKFNVEWKQPSDTP
ncbi:MAG: flippase [Bacteroidota bacterium]